MNWQSWLTVVLAVCLVGSIAWNTKKKALTPPPEMADHPGVRVFFEADCVKCHSVESIPNARATLGPVLDGIAERAATRVEGLDGREYIVQSIREPRAYTVNGFLDVMPRYEEQLSSEELEVLVDWLMTLPPKKL